MPPALFRFTLALSLAGALPGTLRAADEDFKVYTDPPRLLLTKQRLRLLQRERERDSPRWQQFDALVAGGAPLPEAPLAQALYSQVAGNPTAGRKALDWALSDKADASADLRQLAFVFDWCGKLMTDAQAGRLAAKIEKGIGPPANDVARQSARALAAIAIADHLKDQGESILKPIVEDWWRTGKPTLPRDQMYALYEMLHAIRDSLTIDLRESIPAYFKALPEDQMAAHYPAPFPGPDNDFLVPVYTHDGAPNQADAVHSRAAGFAMVAFDTNATETQYLQGWLMQDRYTMRDPLGSVYEFLWANPYQPGLSYSLLPLVFHNSEAGHFFARTSWDEDAAWIGFFDGHLQLFRDGKLQALGANPPTLRVGDAVVMGAPAASPDGQVKFKAGTEATFVLGLAAKADYDVEIDDEELSEASADIGGTLVIAMPPETEAGVRIRKRQESPR
ncbi:MAG TPA: hypothetical protein VGN17_14740 [Bryobacteraceae bacterium]|jgi:hypothetical protein